MTFTNPPIDLAALPPVAGLGLQAPEPGYRRLLRLEWRLTALFAFAAAAALFYFIPSWRDRTAMFVTGGVLGLLLLCWYLAIELGWPWRGYALRSHDIAYRSGWIFRRLQVCPFNRIQNCSLSRGPLDRRYGVATLALYTAGSDSADMKLHGLPVETAESIREFLLNRIHGNHDNTVPGTAD
ncbi:PH domain-containing protein [Flaviaesturariibacter flavus]|uniref:PH domain-containing protein n=1 Tax=Flaviaesturariibacter flavus TaxID=2502780 RepID=A0A4R1BI85_9BACT|nr:PH domain-containing protein [Flaviaesturariibacter flavus]TCJ17015.1 PH domain-containing protein [Flaviaesturariibacter flavus]